MKALRSAAVGLLLTVLPAAAQGDRPEPSPCVETPSHGTADAEPAVMLPADGW